MRVWPRAEFWRQWAVALALSVVFSAAMLRIEVAHAEVMRASFYREESGRFNADGSRFNPMGMTAASKTLAFGTKLEVCLARCAIVTVRDRGPYVAGRALDLARGAARAIGLEAVGVANITVRIIASVEAVITPRAAHGWKRNARRRRRH